MSLYPATISKGIQLFASKGGFDLDNWEELQDLMEIPDLGGSADSIETTTLADASHTYTQGLLNYGDSLDFKFLFSENVWNAAMGYINEKHTRFKVIIPSLNGMSCEFGGTASIKLDGVGANSALTFTLSIQPRSEMVWTNNINNQ